MDNVKQENELEHNKFAPTELGTQPLQSLLCQLELFSDTSGGDDAIGNLQPCDAVNLTHETIHQPLDRILVVLCFLEDHSGASGPNFQSLSELGAQVLRVGRRPDPVPDRHVVVTRLDIVEGAQTRDVVGQERGDVLDRIFREKTAIERFAKCRNTGRGFTGGGVDWGMDPFTKQDQTPRTKNT